MSEAPKHELGTARSVARRDVTEKAIDETCAYVALQYGVRAKDLRSKMRNKKLKTARWEAWRRLARPDVSILAIARRWPCDHTSILYGLGRVKKIDKRRKGKSCNSSHSQA